MSLLAILYTVFAVSYIVISGYRRSMSWTSIAAWGAPAILLNLILIPFFSAFRPLKEGERRVGGKIHVIVKGYVKWSLLLVSGVIGKVWIEQAITASSHSDVGSGAAFIAYVVIMFCYVIAAAFGGVIAWAFKNDTVEQGPTGPLNK